MIEVGKKYHTVDGKEVQIFADTGVGEFKILGAVKRESGWEPYTWRPNGKFMLERDSSLDLEMPEQLKPCPFCGKKEIKIIHDYELYEEGSGGYFVVCDGKNKEKGCGASSGWGADKNKVTKAWNRRV